MREFLEAGKIVGTHGVRGEMRAEAWCDSPEVLQQIKALYFDEGRTRLQLKSRRIHKGMLLFTLEGVDTVEQADLLRGKLLYLNRADIKLEKGRHFLQDLMGLTVKDGNTGQVYGTLTRVFSTGANDVYQIEDKNGREYLFPAVAHMIKQIDLAQGEMLVLPIAGIFDDGGLSDAH